MKAAKIVAIIFWGVLFFNCRRPKAGDEPTSNPPTLPVITSAFVKGADIGWLTQMESSGIKFYNSAGVQEDCIQVLKELGMNAIRLRVWVNPAGGWNGTADVSCQSCTCKKLGNEGHD